MVVISKKSQESSTLNSTCPSCGYRIQYDLPQVAAAAAAAAAPSASSCVQELVGLPAGVKFDPTDQELLEHLEGKATADRIKLHPLIDQFIPTIQGEDGICYTHPEKLPGVRQDGLVRHFFHRPSRAYTTGTRKRRKVQTDADGSETRWHKTGKTRPVLAGGKLAGYKKILVLYTNYGKQRKPEKTNWIMHQYHLGAAEEEKDGELVVSKVFYQTQPRQCSSGGGERGGLLKHVTALQAKHKAVDNADDDDDDGDDQEDDNRAEFYMDQSAVAYNQGDQNRVSTTTPRHPLLLHGLSMHASGGSFLS